MHRWISILKIHFQNLQISCQQFNTLKGIGRSQSMKYLILNNWNMLRKITFKFVVFDEKIVFDSATYEFTYSVEEKVEKVWTLFNTYVKKILDGNKNLICNDYTTKKNCEFSLSPKTKKVSFERGVAENKFTRKSKPFGIDVYDREFFLKLGFTASEFGKKSLDQNSFTASNLPNFSITSNLMFIYTDIIENHCVGHTSSPVLRVVLLRNVRSGPICNVIFPNPYYFKLRKSDIDSISVLLLDETGCQIKFSSGRVFLSLHFRKSI